MRHEKTRTISYLRAHWPTSDHTQTLQEALRLSLVRLPNESDT